MAASSRKLMRDAIKRVKENERKKIIKEKEKLISEVKRRSPIWDRNSAAYRHKDIVDSMWDEVAASMQKDKELCKKKWKNLLDHFRELLLTLKHTASSSGVKAVTKITWPYFESMLFMKHVLESKSTPSSVLAQYVQNEEILQESESNQEILPESITSFEFVEDSEELACSRDNELQARLATETPSPTPTPSTSSSSEINSNISRYSGSKATHRETSRRKPQKQRALVEEALIQELKGVNSQLSVKHGRSELFGAYVADLLQDVDEAKRRKCQSDILKVVNGYADGCDVKVVCE